MNVNSILFIIFRLTCQARQDVLPCKAPPGELREIPPCISGPVVVYSPLQWR